MRNLSPRQAEILEFLIQEIESNGRAPSQTEIAHHFGFRLTAAQDHLRALAAKDYIELNPNSARGIRVLQGTVVHQLPNRVPIIGRIAAGLPVMSEENIEDFVTVDPAMFHPRATYFRRVQGWSMRDANIFDGDLVGLHETHEARSGQIVAVRIEDRLTGDIELTLKRFSKDRRHVVLLSENSDQEAYPPIRLDPARDVFQVEGLFTGLIRPTTRRPP